MLKKQYLDKLLDSISLFMNQEKIIEEIGKNIATSIINGGIVHTFGSGHSDLIAKEVVARAGGLVPINNIQDPTNGKAERLNGIAKILLDEYSNIFGIKEGEYILIISNSGRNPLPIEMCKEAKGRGLKVVALTSMKHSTNVPSRHSSGKKLYELADYVLDTNVELGDTVLKVPDMGITLGPCSTVMGTVLINLIILSVIENIISLGLVPPVLRSMNLDNSDDYNKKIIDKYRSRLNWSI